MADSQAAFDLEVVNLTKRFDDGEQAVDVLAGISFRLSANSSLAITGPSGSGKSTLLHILGTLDQPTSGKVTIGDRDPFALPEPELARFRNEEIGFVFQDHHLLPQYSVLENVLLPTFAFSSHTETAEENARDLLTRVGLGHRLDHRPAQISGGERQRAAVARALIHRPALLLCDEPTGNLDRNSAVALADLLFELQGESDNILIVVTHSQDLANRFGRRFELVDGQCSEA